MRRYLFVERLLIVDSLLWLAWLAFVPALRFMPVAFWGSVSVIAVNAGWSIWTLSRTRRVLIGLNWLQIVLFGVLHFQLYCAYGADHYRCDREPGVIDWIEFTAAHVVRAADVLDALDDYGWAIQTISHASTTSGLLLVAMHLGVDVSLIGLLLRWAQRFWHETPRETRLQQGRREFGWLLATIVLFVVLGIGLQLRGRDWVLWPLDQLLRVADVGDILQVFGWQLHGVESSGLASGAGFLFRLAAGVWMARLALLWRVTACRTWGLSIDELTRLLDDADAQVRRGAAAGLGDSGVDAGGAVFALRHALRDPDPLVRIEAARALGRLGPSARWAVLELADAVWLGEYGLRLAAADALAQIGPGACAAVDSLKCLLKVCDPVLRAAIVRALERIAPSALRETDHDASADATVSGTQARKRPRRRKRGWQRCVNAARRRRQSERAIRIALLELLAEGFFADARDVESLRLAVGDRGLNAEPRLFVMPLLALTSEGWLARTGRQAGRSTYVAATRHT
ncbi:MAG: HEAT repeat domain-containing protein [Planctomycetes bacterium]|nr:HEAT repeat domain-containing protein [Planctomycetota bacterium]